MHSSPQLFLALRGAAASTLRSTQAMYQRQPVSFELLLDSARCNALFIAVPQQFVQPTDR
jgi:hypothetical protein